MEGADPMPLTFLLSDPDAGNGIMTLNLTAVHGVFMSIALTTQSVVPQRQNWGKFRQTCPLNEGFA